MSLQHNFEKYFTSNISEKFKGFFTSGTTPSTGKTRFQPGERSWRERCEYYDGLVDQHGLAKSQVFTIAGQLIAEGLFLEASTRIDETGKAVTYPRSEEALELCQRLNEDISIESKLYDTAVDMAKYGSHFWEKTWTPTYNVRIIPNQKWIAPLTYDPVSGVQTWGHVDYIGTAKAEWTSDQIIHFPWNCTSISWPYGTSLLTGLGTEFSILEQMETDIKEYMHNSAYPKELWSIGDGQYVPSESEVTDIKSRLNSWNPGEHFVTSYPIDYQVGGTGSGEIPNLNPVLTFVKDQIIDGTMVPPISKQHNATEASMKQMMPFFHANLIRPMQRIIGGKLRRELYKPYLVSLGYSVKLVPMVGFVSPETDRKDKSEYYANLVSAGIMPPQVAARELGFEDEFLAWEKEKQKLEAERMQAGKLNQGGEEEEEKKGWFIREVN